MSTMKPGTDTGSGINHIYSRMTKGAPEPEVGMGATILSWTDRRAATVVAVFDERGQAYVTVQEDHAVRIDDNGMSDMQEYRYWRNAQGCEHTFRRDGSGGYDAVQRNPETGRYNKVGNGGLIVGKRDQYRDFSF